MTSSTPTTISPPTAMRRPRRPIQACPLDGSRGPIGRQGEALLIRSRPTRYEAPGRVSRAPTTKVPSRSLAELALPARRLLALGPGLAALADRLVAPTGQHAGQQERQECPVRYPTISRRGFGSSSITVLAARSVGLNAAVSANTKTPPTRLLLASSREPPAHDFSPRARAVAPDHPDRMMWTPCKRRGSGTWCR
jgi:hypothetical protein